MPSVKRHLRMTDADRDRKVARQFARRLTGSTRRGGMLGKLGTEEYWRLYHLFFEAQDGKCGICSKPWVEGTTRMALDHNHDTDEIRGLLCFSCNHKLGFVEKHFGAILNYLGFEVI